MTREVVQDWMTAFLGGCPNKAASHHKLSLPALNKGGVFYLTLLSINPRVPSQFHTPEQSAASRSARKGLVTVDTASWPILSLEFPGPAVSLLIADRDDRTDTPYAETVGLPAQQFPPRWKGTDLKKAASLVQVQ